MQPWLIVLLVIVVVLLVGTTIGRRALAGTDPTRLTLDPAVVQAARALAEGGRKAEAVRTLRAGTPGLSPVAARVMVDKMAAADRGPTGSGSGSPGPAPGSRPVADPPTPPVDPAPAGPVDLPADVELEVLGLLAQGRRADAIDLVRRRSGRPTSECETFVDLLS